MKTNSNANNSFYPVGKADLQPFRRSMPLFLRADPDMILCHRSRKECSSSYVSSSVRTSESNGDLPPMLSSMSDTHVLEEEEEEEEEEEGDYNDKEGVKKGIEDEKEEEKKEVVKEEREVVKGENEEGKKEEGQTVTVTESLIGMTCREYMVNHLIGLRPWRLGKGAADF